MSYLAERIVKLSVDSGWMDSREDSLGPYIEDLKKKKLLKEYRSIMDLLTKLDNYQLSDLQLEIWRKGLPIKLDHHTGHLVRSIMGIDKLKGRMPNPKKWKRYLPLPIMHRMFLDKIDIGMQYH